MNPWRGLAGLPRGVWVLVAATLVNRTGTMFLPFLVLYLTRARGYTPGQAGGTLALFGAGALLAGPFAGRLADRFRPLRVMQISLTASGTLLLVFPLVRSPFVISALVLLVAFVSEAFRPASLSVVSHLVAPDRRKGAFALQRLAINLGMSVGPAAGGFLAEVSWPSLFVVDGVTSLLAALTLALFFPRDVSASEGSGPARPLPARPASVGAPFLFFLLAVIPVGVVFFQHESSMALYLVRDLGFAASTYGLLHTVNTLLIVAFEVPLNLATSHWPHRRGLVLGSILVGAGFGALAFTRTLIGIILTIVVWTFGEMVLLPGLASYVAEVAPEERRGAWLGLYTMSFNLALLIGPAFGTLLLEHFGGRVLWGTMFAFGLLSAVLFARVDESRQEPL
ncbi:MAG: MDR family MFS transporter [Thermoanaerobaculia bacterium]